MIRLHKSTVTIKMVLCSVLIFTLFVVYANSANILGITTVLSPSHHIWNEILAVALARRGHNVTLLSHDPESVEQENYTVVQLKGVYSSVGYSTLFIDTTKNPLPITGLYDYRTICHKEDLQNLATKTLLNYPSDFKFDLILWDVNNGDGFCPFFQRFGNPPVIGVSPFGLQPYIDEILGNHVFNYATFFAAHSFQEDGFWYRLQNTWRLVQLKMARERYLRDVLEESEKVFGVKIRDYGEECAKKVSLVLVNSYMEEFRHPIGVNVVPIGGLHIQKPKTLPKDLEQIMQSSNQGVIYFSIGTNLKPERMGPQKFQAFQNCFADLPYTVLMKIDGANLKLPKNVVAKSWIPQNDVIGHPKTKLFITHGGLLSIQESVHHQVPMVITPFILDQNSNADKYVDKGVARKLKLDDLQNLSEICEAIVDVLENTSYRKNIKTLSERTKDQLNTPLDRAIFWIEYVLRHGSLDHLRPSEGKMSFIAAHNIDLIAALVILLASPFLLVAFFCARSSLKQKLE